MKTIQLGAAVLLLLTAATQAGAHSVREVEQQLLRREKYFQAVNQPAPAFDLRDAAGRVRRLSDYRGRVVVLNFVFTKCPDVCPLHSEKIAQVQKMINDTPMKAQIAFLTVTTDPENDTAKVMRDFGRIHGLDPVNWTFLTTLSSQPAAATRKLAGAYGLRFMTMPDGMQMHPVVTHVIDQDGRLRGRFHGLRFAPVNVVIYANALVNRAQAPHSHGNAEPTLWEKVKQWFQPGG